MLLLHAHIAMSYAHKSPLMGITYVVASWTFLCVCAETASQYGHTKVETKISVLI